ncbi:mucin-5AC isoform X2 [Trematomus bernacchii]|uniref:mucin-5AC isoform X2 n=1 Tax=Trematomus bernacchii TaxID=40690 RepID=UPI00146A7A74|nr:mucin-5AC isoform X2 [Trematomus bernacchii]
MTVNSVCLIFTVLLPLTASSTVTSGQRYNSTNVMTGTPVTQNTFAQDKMTSQEVSSLNPTSITDINTTEEKATTPLQTSPTTPSKTFFPGIPTSSIPTNSTWSQSNSSTVGMKSTTEIHPSFTTSETTDATSHASIPTTTIGTLSMSSSSSQRQFTTDKTTRPFTRPTWSTNPNSTTTTFTEPVENPSTNQSTDQSTNTSTSTVRSGDATQSTGYKTSMATTKKPVIYITKAGEEVPEEKSKNQAPHGKAVAGLIGGALVFMMVGFLVILIKKRKLQKQQITTRDWAGPSPFLEDGADNGQVTLRSSNRISLSSFLPERLSKRLSLLQETDEELKDMTQGTTFGNKGSTFGREGDGNDVQESNGVAVPEIESTGDPPKTVENLTSSPTKDTAITNNNSEVAIQNEENVADPPTLSEAVKTD